MKKRNAPRSAEEVRADIERAPELNRSGVDAPAETRELFEMARDRLRRNLGLFTEADVTKRLFFALLETLTPEQRAEVRRRLGE